MRKLVTLQQVEKIIPIEGADNIELARIKGWQCVVKKGTFKVGDVGIYYEIDSHLPIREPYTAFMAARGVRKSEMEDGSLVDGYRIKTIKLKGQISQGLLLPINKEIPELGSLEPHELAEMLCNEVDLSGLLSVVKYETPIAANMRGKIGGSFPSQWRKSDQERAQNIKHQIYDSYVNDTLYQDSVKNDGSSLTFGKINDEKAVCSRNWKLDMTDVDNLFVKMANKAFELIDEKDHDQTRGDYCFQGELIAQNIQGNFEGVDKPYLKIFNQFDSNVMQFVSPTATEKLVDELGLDHVPVLHSAITLRELFGEVADADELLAKLLDYAEGPSAFGGKYREGVVFKAINVDFSWKVISNSYLTKQKD